MPEPDIDVVVRELRAKKVAVESIFSSTAYTNVAQWEASQEYAALCARHMPAILDALEAARQEARALVDAAQTETAMKQQYVCELEAELDAVADPLASEVQRREGE